MELQLTDDQAAVLREVLDEAIRDLNFEISNTDNPEFKRGLKARQEALREIFGQLTSAGV